MEELEAGKRPVGEARGAEGLALGKGGRGDQAGGKRGGVARRSGSGGGCKGEEGESEVAEIAVEGSGKNLEGAREREGADGVAGLAQRACQFVRTRGQEVEVQGVHGVVTPGAETVADGADKGFAEEQDAVRGEKARGVLEEGKLFVRGKLVEDVVEDDEVVGVWREVKIASGREMGPEEGGGKSGGTESEEGFVKGSKGGTRGVADVEGEGGMAGGGGAGQRGPGGGTGASAQVEDTVGTAGVGGTERQLGEHEVHAGVRQRREVEGVGNGVAGGTEVDGVGGGGGRRSCGRGSRDGGRRGIGGRSGLGAGGRGRWHRRGRSPLPRGLGGRRQGRAGRGKAVGQAADVGKQALDGIAVGEGPGFALGLSEPIGFEGGGIGGRQEGGSGSSER